MLSAAAFCRASRFCCLWASPPSLLALRLCLPPFSFFRGFFSTSLQLLLSSDAPLSSRCSQLYESSEQDRLPPPPPALARARFSGRLRSRFASPRPPLGLRLSDRARFPSPRRLRRRAPVAPRFLSPPPPRRRRLRWPCAHSTRRRRLLGPRPRSRSPPRSPRPRSRSPLRSFFPPRRGRRPQRAPRRGLRLRLRLRLSLRLRLWL
mmetsp:Transcript_56152/g.87440  ORF Transcript_56152/g.87440 Transcript_56152/m.87440 type:complete len:206 (+) Transcript_56152:518-1135(+)